jgi:hypothetical protein
MRNKWNDDAYQKTDGADAKQERPVGTWWHW